MTEIDCVAKWIKWLKTCFMQELADYQFDSDGKSPFCFMIYVTWEMTSRESDNKINIKFCDVHHFGPQITAAKSSESHW